MLYIEYLNWLWRLTYKKTETNREMQGISFSLNGNEDMGSAEIWAVQRATPLNCQVAESSVLINF